MSATARKILALALLLAALAAAAVLLSARRAPAPAFSLPTVDGGSIAGKDLAGKVVLVNFWATSCTTCIKEMPLLAATQKKFGARGFETVAVAMQYDPPAYVANYVRQNALPFRFALDAKGEAARDFGEVRLTPTSFILDRQGRIVQRILGAPDEAQLHALIEKLLAES